MTPTRILSLAPRARVELSAVRPLAMRKLRRVGFRDMALLRSFSDSGGWYQRELARKKTNRSSDQIIRI
jgi:hypothetical protein